MPTPQDQLARVAKEMASIIFRRYDFERLNIFLTDERWKKLKQDEKTMIDEFAEIGLVCNIETGKVGFEF